MIFGSDRGRRMPAAVVGNIMSRVIAVAACGFILAGCSISMPSFDLFRSAPSTEQLRIESEPPGADATSSQGPSCRTPCELTVPTAGELAITFALNGYQQMTVPVRSEAPTPTVAGEPAGAPRLQPNPVYAELQPIAPQRPAKRKRPPAKKKAVATKPAPAPAASVPAPAPEPAPAPAPAPSNNAPAMNYPWPPPPQ
jgi:hypothetical protein